MTPAPAPALERLQAWLPKNCDDADLWYVDGIGVGINGPWIRLMVYGVLCVGEGGNFDSAIHAALDRAESVQEKSSSFSCNTEGAEGGV